MVSEDRSPIGHVNNKLICLITSCILPQCFQNDFAILESFTLLKAPNERKS